MERFTRSQKAQPTRHAALYAAKRMALTFIFSAIILLVALWGGRLLMPSAETQIRDYLTHVMR